MEYLISYTKKELQFFLLLESMRTLINIKNLLSTKQKKNKFRKLYCNSMAWQIEMKLFRFIYYNNRMKCSN